jgi:hypothetical protein
VEKNLDSNPEAARKMNERLASSGRGGSILVRDVNGTLLVGSNPRSVDEALRRTI